MKPVVIFRHARCEGSGYLGAYLDARAIPWCEVRIDLDEELPEPIDHYSGLVFMGGPMSVNDNLPWMIDSMQLIREAIALDIPVLGHCLGGQLMSKALGATVIKNDEKELGWGEVALVDSDEARDWFGDITRFLSFHWHGETFQLPEEATLVLSSPYCMHQAWSAGKHLAMQCHIEMTAEMVTKWSEAWQDELQTSFGPGVQTAAQMHEDLDNKIKALHQVADHVYGRWVQGLVD